MGLSPSRPKLWTYVHRILNKRKGNSQLPSRLEFQTFVKENFSLFGNFDMIKVMKLLESWHFFYSRLLIIIIFNLNFKVEQSKNKTVHRFICAFIYFIHDVSSIPHGPYTRTLNSSFSVLTYLLIAASGLHW